MKSQIGGLQGGLQAGGLEATLLQAQARGLLAGLAVWVSPSVQPNKEQMKEFIECAGGTFLDKLPRSSKEVKEFKEAQEVKEVYCVGSREDMKEVTLARGLGLRVMEREWLLTGLLTYRLDDRLQL